MILPHQCDSTLLHHRLRLFECRENEKENFLSGAIHFSCYDLPEVKSKYILLIHFWKMLRGKSTFPLKEVDKTPFSERSLAYREKKVLTA